MRRFRAIDFDRMKMIGNALFELRERHHVAHQSRKALDLLQDCLRPLILSHRDLKNFRVR